MHFPLPWQLILVLLVVVLVFGASRLPELGRALGEGIRNFKKGISEGDEAKSKLDTKEDR